MYENQLNQAIDSYAIDIASYATAILILAAFFIIAQIFRFLSNKIFAAVAARTKTSLDDKAIKILDTPIFYSIVLFGAYQSLAYIGNLSPYLPDFVKIIKSVAVIIWTYSLSNLVSIVILKSVRRIAKMKKSSLDNELIPIFRRLGGILVCFIGVMIILRIWNFDITPFLASAGIAGFVIAFAAQDTIAHLFGGVSIYFDKPFKIGDRIQLESGEIGDVLDVGVRSTRIKTFDETVIIIPNSKMASSKIINYNLPEAKIKAKIIIGVSYDSDVNKVKNTLLEIAQNTEDVAKEPAPSVYLSELGEYSLKFLVITWVENPDKQFDVKTRMNEAIIKRFKEENISIPYPTQDVNLKKH